MAAKSSNGFWSLLAMAIGASAPILSSQLSGDSEAMSLVLVLAFTLACTLAIGYLNPERPWLLAAAVMTGTLIAQVVLAIPAAEPLSRAILEQAVWQQQDRLSALLAQTSVAVIGTVLGSALSGKS